MGEKPSLDGFYREYAIRLGRFFLSRGVPAQDVDDLVEETFVILLTKRSYIQDGKRQAFLFGIAANVLKAYQRKALLSRLRGDESYSSLEHDVAETSPAPDARAMGHERGDSLERAVSQLPPRMQEVIRLVYFEGNSRAETARIVGIAQATVYEYEKHALERLRSSLDETT